jgi:hypothetical protein
MDGTSGSSRSPVSPEDRGAAVADSEFDGHDAVAERFGVAEATVRSWRRRLPENPDALAAYHARVRERTADGSLTSTAVALDAVNAEIARRARGDEPRSKLSDVHLMGYARALSTAQIQRGALAQATRRGGREAPAVIARLVRPDAKESAR